MKSCQHVSVPTVEGVISILQDYKGRAKIIAGGTDILSVLKDQILPEYPQALINVKTLIGLDYIREDKDVLKIGALAKLSAIVDDPVINNRYQVLAKAAKTVANPQIRNMGTIGGNLAQDTRCWYYRYPNQLGGRIMCLRKGNGPCAAIKGDNRYHAIMGAKECFAVCPSDMAVALSALEATVKIRGPQGERAVPISAFYQPLGNDLKDDEMLTEIQVPKPPESARQDYVKFTLRKPIDFGIISVAAVIEATNGVCHELSMALGGVASTPIRATQAEQTVRGKAINEDTANSAAIAAVADARPLSKNAYKIEIVKSLVKRVLLAANPK
jgi:xanthine dehydrogenase YagS FAD-binding subunit